MMGGRGTTGKTKLFTNIDAARNVPLREARAKELEAERSTKQTTPTDKTVAFGEGNYLKGFLKKSKSSKQPSQPTTSNEAEVAKLRKLHAAAEKKSANFAAARSRLPPGSTRAKITTANARWMRAAEERDRLAKLIDEKTRR